LNLVWQPVPGLAHVEFAQGPWQWDHYMIYFHCKRCNDMSQHRCEHPERRDYWVLTYAMQHGHGMRPVSG
jgi:hypothetical protein